MMTTIFLLLIFSLVLIAFNFFKDKKCDFKNKLYLYFGFVFFLSIIGIFSTFKAGQLNDVTLLFWFLIILFICGIVLFLSQEKSFLVQKINVFIDLDKDKKENLIKFFYDNKICKTRDETYESLNEFFDFLFKGQTPETILIWTDKYQNRLTYTSLLCFFKLVLNDEFYNLKFLSKFINDNKIKFEVFDYPEKRIQDLNNLSLKNALNNLDFQNLNTNQKKTYSRMKTLL